MIDLSHVTAWVFDMDDTLYPRDQGLMSLVQARINAYVVEAVGLDPDSASVLQRQFLDEHGTTLAGLMANYTIEPEHFLHDVHDVPMDGLEPSPALREQLLRLPGRRFVFTNGAREYAGRVLDRLGVTDCFDGVFAIEDADLTPKPAPSTFRRMLERFNFEPRSAAFFEDTPRNLEPAKALGMATVLIGDGHGKPLGDHIDHIAPDLLDFLTELTFKDVAA
ncbi:pyrimidine 5'-nucleotidase [Brevundimonas basaltis]|uniref:Putative hydrolase of the HAD superfamily n=1 Tax=Brevundimonas basaltis TaxID=472166 RepID=A0A7W8MG02_9CAUL|nr:pyrimidine 5'-nucleotidase [Brevundimonas basaltis]MBB5291390.1 putative hydrolase of the HAD superfamily [Brevundimonas basaltis]